MAGDETQRIILPPDDEGEFAPGRRVFDRYKLEALAGKGGMGVVWKAADEKLERTVALKFLPDEVATDLEAVRDLKRETKRCLELTHPNIVRVYDFIQEGDKAAIAMEYVDGQSLLKRKVESPGGCLSVKEIAPLVAELCSALDYAHAKARIVHRDLKPANLLVTQAGDLKVSDFGIARSLTETHTRHTGKVGGGTTGTLLYMSPQQLAGDKPHEGDDIYAFGATIYELLTGKPPFYRGDLGSLIVQVRERAPAPLKQHRTDAGCEGDEIPERWSKVILACLDKNPQRRPRTAGEIAVKLGLETLVGTTTKSHDVKPSPVPQVSKKTLLIAAGALAAVAVIAGAVIFWPKSKPVADDQSKKTEVVSVPGKAPAKEKAGAPTTPVPARPREFTVVVTPASADARLTLGPQAEMAVPANGRAIIRDLPDGDHELVVQAPGYRTLNQMVTVKDGTGEFPARLVPIKGVVEITARPGTKITAIGPGGRQIPVGEVPAGGTLISGDTLPIGTYTLKLEHQDCAPVDATDVKVAIGEPAKVVPTQTPMPGTLEVSSTPAGAEVRVNGTLLGKTPAKLTAQPSETPLEVDVFLRNYRRIVQTVTLKPREPRTLNMGTLVAEAVASLRVASPEGATIFVDNKSQGTAPRTVTDLPFNKVIQVRLEKPGYHPLERSFTLSPDTPETWDPRSEMRPLHPGIEITTLPGAEIVAIDRQRKRIPLGVADAKGVLSSVGLITGTSCGLEISLAGYETLVVDDVALNLNVQKKVEYKLKPKPGRLRVTSRPQLAEVIVDGQRRALSNGQLDVATDTTLTVEARLPGYRPKTQEVKLGKGDIRDLDFGVLELIPGFEITTLPGADILAIDRERRRISLGKTDAKGVLTSIGRVSGESCTLEISLAGYETLVVDNVLLDPKGVRKLSYTLRPKPARLQITSTPRLTEVFVDGERQVLTNGRLDVPPDRELVIEARLPGFRTKTEKVRLEKGDQRPINFGTLEAIPGTLHVTANLGGAPVGADFHAGARLMIDGIEHPWNRGEITGIKPGKHKVELKHDRYDAGAAQTVDVSPGYGAPVTFNLRILPQRVRIMVSQRGGPLPVPFQVRSPGAAVETRNGVYEVQAQGDFTLEVSAPGYKAATRRFEGTAGSEHSWPLVLEDDPAVVAQRAQEAERAQFLQQEKQLYERINQAVAEYRKKLRPGSAFDAETHRRGLAELESIQSQNRSVLERSPTSQQKLADLRRLLEENPPRAETPPQPAPTTPPKPTTPKTPQKQKKTEPLPF